MKKISLILIFLILFINSNSQVQFHASIPFEWNANLAIINYSQSGNIWQKGTPSKTIFNSAHSVPYAIITDTSNSYPVNNISSFVVKITSPYHSWGPGYITFWHKYDTEHGKDGGFVEVQYSNDTTWTNIIFDSVPYLVSGYGQVYTYPTNFYNRSDTILGNIPAFTGTSNGWIQSRFDWRWFFGVKKNGAKNPNLDTLSIRFTFKSDNVQTNQEGWLIDDIVLDLQDAGSYIQQIIQDENNLYVYPNPATSDITFTYFSELEKPVLEIYNILGIKVLEQNLPRSSSSFKLNISRLKTGYYKAILKDKGFIRGQVPLIVSKM